MVDGWVKWIRWVGGFSGMDGWMDGLVDEQACIGMESGWQSRQDEG
jgi:hypothetical protein